MMEMTTTTWKGDERRSRLKKNREAARVWISGLETVAKEARGHGYCTTSPQRHSFCSGSVHAEGTLFSRRSAIFR